MSDAFLSKTVWNLVALEGNLLFVYTLSLLRRYAFTFSLSLSYFVLILCSLSWPVWSNGNVKLLSLIWKNFQIVKNLSWLIAFVIGLHRTVCSQYILIAGGFTIFMIISTPKSRYISCWVRFRAIIAFIFLVTRRLAWSTNSLTALSVIKVLNGSIFKWILFAFGREAFQVL